MLLERIQLTNLLSFVLQFEELEPRPLNVLIGASGSGKPNFVEAIGLVQAAPTDLAARIRIGRGVSGSSPHYCKQLECTVRNHETAEQRAGSIP